MKTVALRTIKSSLAVAVGELELRQDTENPGQVHPSQDMQKNVTDELIKIRFTQVLKY